MLIATQIQTADLEFNKMQSIKKGGFKAALFVSVCFRLG